MKKEAFLLVLKVWLTYAAVFVVWKPAFLLYNGVVSFGDFLAVVWHGLPQDLSTAGYFVLIPLLTAIAASWFKKGTKGLKILLETYFGLTALLISTGLCVDTVLYSFWGFKLDATVLNYIDSPKDVMANISIWMVIIGVLCILTVATGILFLLRWVSKSYLKEERTPSKIGFMALQTLLIIIFGSVIFLFVRGGVGKSTMNVGRVYYSNNQYLNHAAVNPVFSFFSSSLKRHDFAKEYHFFDDEQLRVECEQLFAVDTVDFEPLIDRPNVVLVLMEGFSAKFIGYLGAEKDVAPSLSCIMQEGICFTNCFANSFRTDRGTVSILSGYPAFPNLSVMKMPEKSRALPSIAKTMKENGYGTRFIYGGDINFTNMKSYLLSTGYDQAIGDSYFPVAAAHTNAWGANDQIVLDTLAQMIERAKSPFFYTCLTLSSHEPWEVPYNKYPNDKKANSFAYADSCLGVFINRMKASAAWDNTLFVFIADHGVAYPEDITEADPTKHHIPMFIVGGPLKEPIICNKICNQSDLASTLLALMGMKHDDYNFSRNILSRGYSYPYAIHTYSGGVEYIDSTGATVLDLTSMKPLTEQPSPSDERIKRAKAYLQATILDIDKK